jgi:hypothetical protein
MQVYTDLPDPGRFFREYEPPPMAPAAPTLPRVTTVAACRWGHPGRTGNWWGTNDTCDVDESPTRFATGWLRQVRPGYEPRGEPLAREDGFQN